MIVHVPCAKVGHRQAPPKSQALPLNSGEGFVLLGEQLRYLIVYSVRINELILGASMSVTAGPVFGHLSFASLRRALSKGWALFLITRPLSVTFAMIFAVIGIVIVVGIERASYAPMIFPLAGGFLFIGPMLLAGFFSLADRVARGQACSVQDIVSGFARISREMLAIAFACTVLFIVWVIDTAMLYGFLVGRTPAPLLIIVSPEGNVLSFLIWSSVFGSALAFIIFSISAFSVPLLYYRRATLLQAVKLSIKAVFSNIGPCVVWALVLGVSIVCSILLFPLFLLTFPVLAFASHALYRELFPG